jgi:hypothetical protein
MARRTRRNAGTPRVTATAALCAVAVLAGVAACGAAGGGQGGSQAAQAGANGSEAAVLRQFVDCVRAHGVPDFPDGSIDSHGVVSFPDSAPRVPGNVATACQVYFNRLPPQPSASPPVPQPVFQELLSFARCMRAHGVPDWPDPAPSGTFFLDSRLIAAGKRGVYRQVQVCQQANPGVSGHFSVAQGS